MHIITQRFLLSLVLAVAIPNRAPPQQVFLKSRLSSQSHSRRAVVVTLWPGRSPR